MQAAELSSTAESLGRRWRSLAAAVAARAEQQGEAANINIIVGWTEQTLVLVARPVNASCLADLRAGLEELQGAQVALHQQQVSLEDLSVQVGVSSPLFLSTRQKVERIGALLPRRVHTLGEKLKKLEKLEEGLAEGGKWLQEAEGRRTGAESREEQLRLRLAVSDREYTMNQLFNEFLLLERELASSGLTPEAALAQAVSSLKRSWLNLAGSVRRVTTSSSYSNSSTGGARGSPSRRILTSPDANQNRGEVEEPRLLSSPSSLCSSGASLGTGGSSLQDRSAASSNPLQEQDTAGMPQAVITSLGAKSARVVAWLAGLAAEGEEGQGVNLEDTGAVARELDRHRALLQQLEARKVQMEEITATATDLQPGAEDVVNKINLLRSQWKSVQGKLLDRKAELTTMLEHSDNLDTKGKEVSEWLGRLERQLAGGGVGKTREVLLHQIREVNEVHRELQRYSHHVSLFSQMCQRLVSIYCRDNTLAISQLAEELGGRYSGLTSSCLARGKSLKAALEALNSFDRELAEFLTWLGEEEGAVERLEQSSEAGQLAERQSSVRARDGQFCGLAARGRDMVLAAGQTDVVLASKVQELGRRWSNLQNSLMCFQDKLERRGGQQEGKLQEQVDLQEEGRLQEPGGWLAERLRGLEAREVGSSIKEIQEQKAQHGQLRQVVVWIREWGRHEGFRRVGGCGRIWQCVGGLEGVRCGWV